MQGYKDSIFWNTVGETFGVPGSSGRISDAKKKLATYHKYSVETVPDNMLNYLQQDVNIRANKSREFQTFSGSDIKAVMYMPLLTKSSLEGIETPKFKMFADLQTISISSTRSVSPVRVFGRSSPLGYTRGARTFAGTLVFATIRKDPFVDMADAGITESYVNSSTSIVADQLPPFSIVINAVNETGAVAGQIIHGITITNFGTTYSVDDLYTETTYTYVATDVHPLSPGNMSRVPGLRGYQKDGFNSISNLVEDSLKKAYGTVGEIARKISGTLQSARNARIIDQINSGLNSDPYFLQKNPNLGQ